MDTTRISIARLLALDVPLTWQDAVAVAQEAAMLSDVHAAMNSRPSLVSPETCFLTRTGDLELPVMTDVESPDAVTELLREMLAGRDAPEALETLAFGHGTRDMSGALQAFPITNRRAAIAKLATRALALQSPPLDAPAAPAISVPPVPASPPLPTMPPPLAAVVVTAPARAPEPRPIAPATSFVRQAPFRAADVPPPPPVAAPPPPVSGVPDAELRRLRHKSRERALTQRQLSRRFGAVLGRMASAVSWRPATPDPRILGSALIVAAAVVSVVWTSKSESPTSSTSAATPAAGAAGTTASGTEHATSSPASAPVAGPSGSAAAANATGPTGLAMSAAMPRTRSVAARREPAGTPPTLEPTAGPSADAVSMATAERVPSAPPRGITVTLPALDAPPGPLTASSLAESRATDPRGSEPRGADSRPPAFERRSARGEAVYSSSDDEVTPPVLLRQQLPSPLAEPPAEVPDDWPYLELVIDRAGLVEQVRLRAKQPAPGQTLYRHRMLLAAAKAWQFEPARRRGTPVRYVMRVPLEP